MKRKNNYMVLLFLFALAICCLIPFVSLVSASFSSEIALKKYGYTILPKELSMNAYSMLFRQWEKIVWAYITTIGSTTCGTLCSIALQSGFGYVLSRHDYTYRNKISFYMYFTMLFGGGMIPLYLLISNYLHMKDTFWVLFVPLLFNGGNVYMLRNFFGQIPFAVIESAKIDGANEFTIFTRLALPMVKTGLATISIFLVLGFWNESFMSLMYMTSEKIITIQYLLTKIINNITFFQVKGDLAGGMLSAADLPSISLRMATVVVTVGPMLCVFPFFQKYFVRGLTGGAVKE